MRDQPVALGCVQRLGFVGFIDEVTTYETSECDMLYSATGNVWRTVKKKLMHSLRSEELITAQDSRSVDVF